MKGFFSPEVTQKANTGGQIQSQCETLKPPSEEEESRGHWTKLDHRDVSQYWLPEAACDWACLDSPPGSGGAEMVTWSAWVQSLSAVPVATLPPNAPWLGVGAGRVPPGWSG